jgi:intein/homing endonuclease
MKVMVNNSLVYVTEVNIGDRIGSTIVTDVIKKHMREGYLIINNELKITNDHPLLVNNEWVRADALSIGDNVNGVMISSIEYVQKLTPTVYIETESDSYEVYCDNNSYTVSGKYGQELKKNIKRAA